MNNSKWRVGVAFAAVVVVAFVGWADEKPTIYQNSSYSGDQAGYSGFIHQKGKDGVNIWTNGRAPEPGTNYVWTSGSLRTPDNVSMSSTDTATYRFAGDRLTLKGGTLAQKTCGAKSLMVVDDLVFSNNTSWAQSCSPNSLPRIGGVFTVAGKSISIYSSYASTGCRYDFLFLGRFKSASGFSPTVTVRQYAYQMKDTTENYPAEAHVRLAGDNGDFLGKWSVQNVAPASGYPYIDKQGMVLVVEHAQALGGDTGSAVADAVTLSNHGGLAVAPELCAEGPFAPANKGITIGARAGRLTTISNETWSLGMPITGGADKNLVKSGAGVVRLCGTYDAGPVTVEEGTLVWVTESAIPQVTVADGACFRISADGERVLSGQSVSAIEVVLDAAEHACGKIVLDSTCTIPDGFVSFSFDKMPAADDYTRYEIMEIPVSVREVTDADFVDATGGTAYRWFSVERVGDVQKVYIIQRQAVGLSVAVGNKNPGRSNGQWFFTDATAWSDGLVPTGEKDYVVDRNVSSTLRSSAGSSETLVFAGNSLTLENSRTFAQKNSELVVSNFILKASSLINAAGSGGLGDQWISGTMVVDSSCTESSPAKLEGQILQTLNLSSELRGSGVLSFRPYDQSAAVTNTAISVINGDNSHFLGIIQVYSLRVAQGATNIGQTLAFPAPECLGGPLAKPLYNGVHVGVGCVLQPSASMVFDTVNRGLYFEMESRISVPTGVFTLKSPLRKYGTLYKEGNGTLSLACDVTFGKSGAANPGVDNNNVIDVLAGGLSVAKASSFKDLSVRFHAESRLELSPEVADESIRVNGIYSERTDALAIPDGVLNVEIAASPAFLEAHREFSVPVCTVPQAIADAIDGKIKMAKLKGWKGAVSRETLESGMVRFTMNVARKGLLLIFR